MGEAEKTTVGVGEGEREAKGVGEGEREAAGVGEGVKLSLVWMLLSKTSGISVPSWEFPCALAPSSSTGRGTCGSVFFDSMCNRKNSVT